MGTSMQTKLQAIAELEAGDDAKTVAARYGLTKSQLSLWKERWDGGKSLDDEEPEDSPQAAVADEPTSQEPEEEDDEEEEEVPRKSASAATKKPSARSTGPSGGLRTKSGAELPPPPAQQTGIARRVFPDEFKYEIAKAILARDVSAHAVAEFYEVSPSVLYHWTEAVRGGKLKRQNAGTPSPRLPLQSPPRERAQPVAPAVHVEPTQLATIPSSSSNHPAILMVEVEHLRRENRRLRRQLERALSMVLEPDEERAIEARVHG